MEIEYRLRTPRTALELIDQRHAEELFQFMSNPEISKDMSWSAHKSLEETKSFIQKVKEAFNDGKSVTWVILFENRIAGIFSLIAIKRRHRSLTYDNGELAYWLGEEFRGRGLMTEIGKEVIRFAFEDLNLNKLLVGHHLENEGSKGLIERLGFKKHYVDHRAFKKNGTWIDTVQYQLFNENYNN